MTTVYQWYLSHYSGRVEITSLMVEAKETAKQFTATNFFYGYRKTLPKTALDIVTMHGSNAVYSSLEFNPEVALKAFKDWYDVTLNNEISHLETELASKKALRESILSFELQSRASQKKTSHFS